MLNISPNSIQGHVPIEKLNAFSKCNLSSANRLFIQWLVGTMLVILILFFLPWTQNIQSKGKVTTLRPEQRPQTIHSTIAGRIEKWYVQEGQRVSKGDTIVFLSEVKAEYFDPDLISRTGQQVTAKEGAIDSYRDKAKALQEQIEAMKVELRLKREQLENKIQQVNLKIESDSIELERAIIDYDIAVRQRDRSQEMYNKGINPLYDLEQKNLKVQSTKAKRVAAENKLMTSQNELLNAQIALNSLTYEYNQKIAKASSDRFSTLSDLYASEADVSKLRIQASNYKKRNNFYHIIAPQDAFITKALKPGIGETVKGGDPIVSIMPSDYELAVEIYVDPMDLPLLNMGQEVRFIFDGWPAFIFSGWPGFSFGTFSGQIVAIDNMISDNGQYRILVAPINSEKPWPDALRPGSGAQSIALLNNVPVWYEIWRQLNGFPPDFYADKEQYVPKLKAPIKSVPK